MGLIAKRFPEMKMVGEEDCDVPLINEVKEVKNVIPNEKKFQRNILLSTLMN